MPFPAISTPRRYPAVLYFLVLLAYGGPFTMSPRSYRAFHFSRYFNRSVVDLSNHRIDGASSSRLFTGYPAYLLPSRPATILACRHACYSVYCESTRNYSYDRRILFITFIILRFEDL